MARAAMVLTAVLALLVAGEAAAAGVSPVQKVIELLEENKGKIQADLASEEKEMTEYAAFCDDELTQKGFAIKTATTEIAKLKAAIEEGDAAVAELQASVAELGTEMAAKEKQLASESAVRNTGRDAFEKTEGELMTSIDELERALATLKQGESFLQTTSKRKDAKKNIKAALEAISRIVAATTLNSQKRRQLQGLIQTARGDDSEDLNLNLNQVAPPEAAAFESATGGIIEQVEEMKEKAEASLSDARNTEMQEQHTFDMMAQSLNDGIKVCQDKLASAKSSIEVNTEEAGEAKGELVETEKVKASDEAYVKTLSAECEQAKEAWAARQESAKEEMAVIEKAKGILADRVTALVQVGGKAVRASRQDGDSLREAGARSQVVEKLRALSRSYRSFALMEMVSAAQSDPFVKIRGLIEDMIAKLLQEANEEATQKAFCDEELGKSNTAKDDKTLKKDKLTARLEKASTTKAELEASVKELEAEVAELDKGEAEATKIRQEEHATYEKESKDFKDSAEAVTEAVTMLKEYYEGASLLQTGSGKAPSFGGNKGEAAHTIIAILEMSGEDFEKLYMETEQEEAEAAAAYKKLTDENKVSRAAKAAETKGAMSEIKSLDVQIKNGQEDVDTISKELEAVLAYLDKLKPQCETQVMSYAEKKARREAEIEGLKEALSILA